MKIFLITISLISFQLSFASQVDWAKIVQDAEECSNKDVSSCGRKAYKKFYLESLRKHARGVDAFFFKENFFKVLLNYKETGTTPEIVAHGIRALQLEETSDFKSYLDEIPSHNSENSPHSGFISKDCLIDEMPIKLDNEKCQPDTLYSWGNIGKTKAILSQIGKSQVWPETLSRELWLTQFPTATYFYGDSAIRIKIKKGVKFKNGVSFCPNQKKLSKMSQKQKSDFLNTVTYRVQPNPLGYLVEYVICSPHVIESWSYDTPEFYNELLREISWINSKEKTEYNFGSYAYRNGKPMIRPNIKSEPFHPRWEGVDGYLFNTLSLYKTVKKLRKKATDGNGEVIFNPDSFSGDSNHFQTKMPIYFN
jgi:hypothetical protein